MYKQLPSFVLGFHGCDRAVAETILAGNPMSPSKNDYDWLGQGIFFWENSPDRALSYATSLMRYRKRGKGSVKDPYVIGAVINLGHCFNLTEEGALLELKRAYELLNMAAVAEQAPLPQNEPGFDGDPDLLKRHLDCAVFRYLHAARDELGYRPYQSIRSPFLEGRPVYPGTAFMEKTHVQVCVRDPMLIKGYFRPLNPDGSVFQP
ncbi:hypothetical protein [Pseudomonas sp. NPDC007930]|uniref:hypothetical protein n=1 Tax=Pseudomonas sp. NPDC007930 TaxID=3364417 RepID=UPI0036EBCB7C